MALDKQKLYDGLIKAFDKGIETSPVSNGEDGETESRYTKSDIAGFIADAIVDYASEAEILLLPGPLIIPAPTPVPDLANLGSILKIQTADIAKPALKASIEASLVSKDPVMGLITTGIMAYIPASFTLFKSITGNIATGVTLPTIPPVLAPCTALGMVGSEEDKIVELMAIIIHATFKSSVFNGAGASVVGGFGPVIFQPLL